MAIEIKNRVALVTGANRGIGRALVEAVLDRGLRALLKALGAEAFAVYPGPRTSFRTPWPSRSAAPS